MTTLIADSGGSKTDWRMIRQNGCVNKIASSGFNPCTMPKTTLEKMLHEHIVPLLKEEKIDRVFFYGAGITSKENEKRVHHVLTDCFVDAEVFVHSDLLGAARALCGIKAGIVGILGTGSNCCFYQNDTMTCRTPSLGWVLGDEGSGTHLGKILVRNWLYGHVPRRLEEPFQKTFQCSKESLLKKIYDEVKPNALFAHFVPFIAQHKEDPYCRNLAYQCFEAYFNRHINAYRDYAAQGIYLTGSVAYYFSDILKKVAVDMHYEVKLIVQAPIENLISYHEKR